MDRWGSQCRAPDGLVSPIDRIPPSFSRQASYGSTLLQRTMMMLFVVSYNGWQKISVVELESTDPFYLSQFIIPTQRTQSTS